MALQYPLTGESDAEDERSTKREGLARAVGTAGVQWPFGAGILPAGASQREHVLRLALEDRGGGQSPRRRTG